MLKNYSVFFFQPLHRRTNEDGKGFHILFENKKVHVVKSKGEVAEPYR